MMKILIGAALILASAAIERISYQNYYYNLVGIALFLAGCWLALKGKAELPKGPVR